eukprot:872721-Rhodomonas_salina.1
MIQGRAVRVMEATGDTTNSQPMTSCCKFLMKETVPWSSYCEAHPAHQSSAGGGGRSEGECSEIERHWGGREAGMQGRQAGKARQDRQTDRQEREREHGYHLNGTCSQNDSAELVMLCADRPGNRGKLRLR